MIPRNILHRTTLQTVTQKSKDPTHKYEFEDNKLFIQKHSGNENNDIFHPIQKQIRIHQWKEIKSLEVSFLVYHKKDASKFGDFAANNLASIERLDLKCMTHDTIQASELEVWAHQIPRSCRKLKHISMRIRLNNNKHEAVQILAQEISLWIKSIRSLSFNFKKSEPRHQDYGDDISQFSKILSRCQKLQNLSIALNESKIQDRSLQGLSYWICTKLIGLQKLSLEFEETQVTDKGVEELTGKIGKNLPMLNHLCLLFDETQVTDKGIQMALRNLLPLNDNLGFLNLRFPQPKIQMEKSSQELKDFSANAEIIRRFGYLALIRNPHGLCLTRS